MSRISDKVLQTFRLIGNSSECYFCGSPKRAFDTTPHRSVVDKAPDSMERIRVAVCTSCGQRIHYANMFLEHSAKREGAEKGLMSFEAKKRLCSTAKWSKSDNVYGPRFVSSNGLLIPNNTTFDDDRIYVGGIQWSLDELRAIQGPIAIRSAGLPSELVAECFWALVVADDVTKVIDVEKSKALLEI